MRRIFAGITIALLALLASMSCNQQRMAGEDSSRPVDPAHARPALSTISMETPERESIITWDAEEPRIGIRQIRNGRYSYDLSSFEFGIEMRIDGKIAFSNSRPPLSWSKWVINCRYPSSIGHSLGSSCSLEETAIGSAMPGLAFPILTRESFASNDNTVREIKADWAGGKLDFTVAPQGDAPVEVMIRFRWDGDWMCLTDFKAASVLHGAEGGLSLVEYRIREYSSVLSVPIELRGLRPSGQQAWEELIHQLPAADQTIWLAIRADRKARPDFSGVQAAATAKMRVMIPDADWDEPKTDGAHASGKREPKPEELVQRLRAVREKTIETFDAWLAKTAFSPLAKDRIGNYFRDQVAARQTFMFAW
jgi:hypothetical protein